VWRRRRELRLRGGWQGCQQLLFLLIRFSHEALRLGPQVGVDSSCYLCSRLPRRQGAAGGLRAAKTKPHRLKPKSDSNGLTHLTGPTGRGERSFALPSREGTLVEIPLAAERALPGLRAMVRGSRKPPVMRFTPGG